MEQCVAQTMLLGPVPGGTPGPGNPVFNLIVGSVFITAVWAQYFRRERAANPPIRAALSPTVIGAFFIALGVWGLISPH
jgi:hypothetical protein